MANNPPPSNDSASKVSLLLQRLDDADEPLERLPLLDELSFYARFSHPKEGERYAREELRVATSIKDGHWMMMSYIRLAEAAGMQSNYSLGLRYWRKAWKLLENLPDNPERKSRVCRSEAGLLFEVGEIDKAMELYDDALRFAEQSGSQVEIASSLAIMCGVYIDTGLYSKGLWLATKALEISQEISHDTCTALSLFQIGRVYFFLKDWEMALANIHRSLDLYRQIGSNYGIGRCYSGIGSAYLEQSQFDEAMKWYSMASSQFERIGNPFNHAEVLCNIAGAWAIRKKFEKSLASLDEAEHLYDAINNDVGKAAVQLQKGQIYVHMEEWERAIAAMLTASEVFEKVKSQTDMIYLEQLLANAYEQNGNVAESLHHYKRYMEFERGLLSNEVRHQLASHQTGDRIRNIEKEKRIIQARADELAREIEERSQEVTLLSLRIGEDDELLKQLRRRLREMKHANGHITSLINSLIKEIDNRDSRVNSWNLFRKELEALDGEFVRRLTTEFGTLTKSETRICMLLRLNMSNKEIAALLSLSERTIERHRTNIRGKLGLEAKASLTGLLSRL